MMDPATLTACGQVALLRTGEVSAVELLEATLARVRALDPQLDAFITLMADEAREDAERADARLAEGHEPGALHGVPVALKDNFETRGVRTTAGSRVLEGYLPPRDATAVARLRSAGALVIGKTLLSEFACADAVFGTMRNPWDLERIAGYSSGGSAAAVAARLCPVATGHDTGGSIRIPAAFSGIVGLKPTYGRVSRRGVLPFSWSMDHAGPLTRTVEDAALVMEVMAGHDAEDPTASRAPVPNYRAMLAMGAEGLRLGLPREWFFDLLDEEVLRSTMEGVALLEKLVGGTRRVSAPLLTHTLEIGHVIQWAEAADYHDTWLRERPEKYGAELLQTLRAARLLPAADYVRAQRLRRDLRGQLLQALEAVDLLVTPTTPISAPRLDQTEYVIRDRPVSLLYAAAAFTLPFNLAGLPAISVPCGFTREGLPIGLQIVGRPFEEATVLRAAHAFQAQTDWHQRMPSLHP